MSNAIISRFWHARGAPTKTGPILRCWKCSTNTSPDPKGKRLSKLIEWNGRAVRNDLEFRLQADLIIRGWLPPDAQLTLQGDPVTPREDGSFLLKMNLQEGRQLIPAVAVSSDGLQQCTIVLAIERNTKELEPQALEEG